MDLEQTGNKRYSLTESYLIQECIKNKPDAQRILFEKYAGKMMSLCKRYVNDQQEAQDILQVGFMKVFEYIHQYKNEGSFEGWMRKVFASIAIRHVKKKKIDFTAVDMLDDNAASEGPAIISKLSEEEIHQFIRSLPMGYRTVFNLHVIEGYSHDEIAELLNIKPATSRTQLLKARKLLQVLICKRNNTVKV
jgi:RNA polymerase sigma factor (sigma-70 family)